MERGGSGNLLPPFGKRRRGVGVGTRLFPFCKEEDEEEDEEEEEAEEEEDEGVYGTSLHFCKRHGRGFQNLPFPFERKQEGGSQTCPSPLTQGEGRGAYRQQL